MRTHGLTDPVIELRRQTDYQYSPNWLSGAEDELSQVSPHGFAQVTSSPPQRGIPWLRGAPIRGQDRRSDENKAINAIYSGPS
jgi:hypothetical protein